MAAKRSMQEADANEMPPSTASSGNPVQDAADSHPFEALYNGFFEDLPADVKTLCENAGAFFATPKNERTQEFTYRPFVTIKCPNGPNNSKFEAIFTSRLPRGSFTASFIELMTTDGGGRQKQKSITITWAQLQWLLIHAEEFMGVQSTMEAEMLEWHEQIEAPKFKSGFKEVKVAEGATKAAKEGGEFVAARKKMDFSKTK